MPRSICISCSHNGLKQNLVKNSINRLRGSCIIILEIGGSYITRKTGSN